MRKFSGGMFIDEIKGLFISNKSEWHSVAHILQLIIFSKCSSAKIFLINILPNEILITMSNYFRSGSVHMCRNLNKRECMIYAFRCRHHWGKEEILTFFLNEKKNNFSIETFLSSRKSILMNTHSGEEWNNANHAKNHLYILRVIMNVLNDAVFV